MRTPSGPDARLVHGAMSMTINGKGVDPDTERGWREILRMARWGQRIKDVRK